MNIGRDQNWSVLGLDPRQVPSEGSVGVQTRAC